MNKKILCVALVISLFSSFMGFAAFATSSDQESSDESLEAFAFDSDDLPVTYSAASDLSEYIRLAHYGVSDGGLALIHLITVFLVVNLIFMFLFYHFLHNKIQNEKTGTHLFSIKSA